MLKAEGSQLYHSVRRDFTGFLIAVFTAWKLTVNKAMSKAVAPATRKMTQLI